MHKKFIFFTIFLFFIFIKASGQCAAFVQISANPAGQVCKFQSVTFQAIPTNGGANPQYFWIINGDTVDYDDTYTGSFSQDQVIQVMMISSMNCDPDTVFATYNLDVMNFTADGLTKTIYCNDDFADIQLTNMQDGREPYMFVLDGQFKGSSGYFEKVTPGGHVLSVTDNNGCRDTVPLTVVKAECPPIEPVPVLSPNGDNRLDFWIIIDIDKYPDNEVYIFDRWGQRVFYKKGYKNIPGEAWDGTYMGTPLPEAAYYYVIDLKAQDSEGTKRVKGAVSIVR